MKIGVLGGGQLGRMLALAGYPLDLQFRFLDPAPGISAGSLGEHLAVPFDDPRLLQQFAEGLDLVTYEFENVPVETARSLRRHVPVFPPPQALEIAQDRVVEKDFFTGLKIPTAPYLCVDSPDDLRRGVTEFGLPSILKTRRLGYDGKGQAVLWSPVDVEAAWNQFAGSRLILEKRIEFEREVSILAVRDRQARIVFYPLVENKHRAGMLRVSRAPAPEISPRLQSRAEDYARRVLESLEYSGVLALELFVHEDGLLANEMACRVHNSGHWTIDGAETSQFENHLRAICGWSLGSTAPRGFSGLVNLIGSIPDPAPLLAMPGVHLHLYGKTPHPGRKLGHVNVVAPSPSERDALLAKVEAQIGEE